MLPAAREEGARLRAKDDRLETVDKERHNLETGLKRDLRRFREQLDSMKSPSEQLLAVLRESNKPPGAAAGFATFGDAAAAAASPFAQAYGGEAGIAAEIAGAVWVLRRARNRATIREYLVEKLRLGMLARTLAGYAASGPQSDTPAARAFAESKVTPFPLVAKSVSGSWTLPVPAAGPVVRPSREGRAPIRSVPNK